MLSLHSLRQNTVSTKRGRTVGTVHGARRDSVKGVRFTTRCEITNVNLKKLCVCVRARACVRVHVRERTGVRRGIQGETCILMHITYYCI